MKKSIFCGIALVAGLWSCTEDYTDWASPQQNAANEAAQKLEMMMQPTLSSIDFATYSAETVQLFTTNLTEQQANEYDVLFMGDDATKGVVLKANATGNVQTEELKDAVITLFGQAPTERTLNVTVSTIATNATADGPVKVQREASPFILKAKLDAPFIDPDGYYYVGAIGTNKTYKLSNGGGNVYDDPVFTGTIPTYEGDWHWFKIAPSCAFNEDGTFNWDNEEKYCIGPTVKDDEGVSGQCATGKLSWHLIQSEEYVAYQVTINALEMTYSIKGIKAIPEYYGVGTMTNWNANTKCAAMFPTSNKTITLTTYFTGAWDMRMWPAENFGDWNNGKAIGTAVNGDNAASGALCWNNDNDGNLASPEAGYYTLDCDLGTMTYKWTKCDDQRPDTYEKIGLVGGNDDWDNDVFLTQVENKSEGKLTHLWYALNVKIDNCTWGVQFRANGAWDKQWGKGELDFPFATSNSKDNISLVPGTYNVYFNDITGNYFFVAQ